jgi:protein-L-isoaspartate(D-aspartate) O-methyltransferase
MNTPSERNSTFISSILRETPRLTDERVIGAMASVDRALFVPPSFRSRAYDTAVISLDGYTLSEPGLVGLMIQSLDLRPNDVVLDIGSGSGYHAAVMSRLCRAVYGVEVLPHAVERSRAALRAAQCDNVYIRCGDGWDGWSEYAPYDAINVACAAERLAPTLLKQMKNGARMIIPLSDEEDSTASDWQQLALITKRAHEPLDPNGLPPFTRQNLSYVRFVPMVHGHH